MSQATSFFRPIPVRPKERVWGLFAFACVSFSVVVATWSFLIGAVVAEFANASVAVGVVTFGYLSTFVLLAFSLLMCQRYGLDPYTAAQPIFGVHGSSIILILAIVVAEGWMALIAVMFGQAIVNVLTTVSPGAAGPIASTIFVAANLAFVVIVWLITWKGPLVIRYMNLVIAPVLLVVLLWMTVLVLRQQPWTEFVAVPPTNPFGDFHRDNVIALELVFGVTWSWWPYAGIWMRLARTERVAFHGTVWGSGLGFVIATLLATLSALAVGSHDPTTWMVAIGGALFGVIALLFIAVANIMSEVGQLYPIVIGAQFWRSFRSMRWGLLVAIFLLPVAAVSGLDPDTLFGLTGTLMILCGVFFAPACAIYITDFWLLRRGRLAVGELFKAKGAYGFYRGWNPAALIALATGFVVYLLLLNPVTVESRLLDVFLWTTATVPTLLITGAVYYFLTKLWIIPRGLGGYPARAGAEVQERQQ